MFHISEISFEFQKIILYFRIIVYFCTDQSIRYAYHI